MDRFVWLLIAFPLGCSEQSPKSVADAGLGDDAGADEIAGVCEGSCAEMSLQAKFGPTTRSFERAFFGLTAPGNSESGQWELYVENNSGDDTECPTESSPTPRFLMTLSGMEIPAAPAALTVTANLVDFEGSLLTDSVFEKATSATLHWTAALPCLECAQGTQEDHSDRMLAFDIDASFPGGTISGHSYATHCDSLDKL